MSDIVTVKPIDTVIKPIDTVIIKPKLQMTGDQGICPKCGAIVLPGEAHICVAGNKLKTESVFVGKRENPTVLKKFYKDGLKELQDDATYRLWHKG